MAFALTLAYLVLLFVRPFDLGAGEENLPVMIWLGAITLIVTAAAWMTATAGTRPSLSEPQFWLTLAFVAFAIVPWLVIGWLGEARAAVVQLQPVLGAFAMVAINVTTIERLRRLAAALLCAFAVITGESLVSYYTGWQHDTFVMDQRVDVEPDEEPSVTPRVRHMGFLNDPNDFAQALVTMLPLVAAALRPKRPILNYAVLLPLAAAFLWALVLTRSRGGVLALSIMMVLALRDNVGKRKAMFLTALLIGAIVVFTLSAGRAFRDESSENRIEAWASGIVMLRSNPILGVGYNGYVEEHRGLTAHNSFVLAFTETGLVGYFVWMALLVLSYMELTRLANLPGDDPAPHEIRRWARGLRLALSAFLAGAYFLSRTYVVTLYILLALVMCLKHIARREGLAIERIGTAAWTVRTLQWECLTIVSVWLSVKLAGA